MNKPRKTLHHYSVKPATLILGPSRWLASLFALMGSIAGVAILLLSWAWWVKAILIVGIIAAVVRQINHDAWRKHPTAPVIIELDPAGRLWLTKRNGMRYSAQVQGSTLVTAGFTVLNLKLEQGRVSCVILPDAVDAEAFRRLRVWLRWRTHEENSANTVKKQSND